MPKRVDHEQRRGHLAEAMLRIAAGGGLDAVGMREVASEAGVSLGMVQHYFESKEEMLRFACAYLAERTERRVRERLAESTEPRTTRSILRHVFAEMLPLDEERRAAVRVWVEFHTRSLANPDLSAFMRDNYSETHGFIAGRIRAAREAGEIPADLDPDREAVALFSLVDGLIPHMLVGHYSGEQALAAVDDHLERLFGDRAFATDRL